MYLKKYIFTRLFLGEGRGLQLNQGIILFAQAKGARKSLFDYMQCTKGIVSYDH